MDRRSGKFAPFRITPASKPGAGAYDHWEGAPSWGNTHGAEWFELAGTETVPGTETTENAEMTLTRESDYVLESHGDDFVDSFGHHITVRGHNDWLIDRTEIVNRYFDSNDVKYYLYRISGSTPETHKFHWNAYRYEFLEWKLIRQETRTV